HINVEFDEPLIDEEISGWNAGVLAGWPGVRPAAYPPEPNILPNTSAARTRAEPAGETPAFRRECPRVSRKTS
ncbi:MAG: hypothetical protein QOC81_3849, partial [Thermoanaerobaculia bacterium]|nr:hypothetical protein [Thermoanaerobaculia bacterium]